MKTSIKILLALTIALSGTYVLAATALLPFGKPKLPKADSVFISTHWKQMGGFETCTPDRMRTGCWSTALAQIMYYHHLKPFGHVTYTSSKGYSINQNIDSTAISFDMLAAQIDGSTSKAQIAALAQYNYYAALAVKKDFGTDNYMQKLASPGQLEQHYRVKVSRYICWQHVLPYTTGKLQNVIRTEISNKRPVFLHFSNLKNFGHSVVIDGYKTNGNNFMVHLNQGQGGPQDGWYNFGADILKPGDRALRVIYTFKPS